MKDTARFIFFIATFLILLGPITLFSPFVDDSRIVGMSLLAAGVSLIILFSDKKNSIFSLLLSNSLAPLWIFVLSVLVSAVLSPPAFEKDQLLAVGAGAVAFYFGFFILAASNNISRELQLFHRVIIIVSVLVSLASVSTLLFQTDSLPIFQQLLTQKGYAKLVYEYRRGRIYPLSSPDVLLVFTLNVLMTARVTFFTGVIAALPFFLMMLTLMTDNFRSRILAGLFGIACFLWLRRSSHFVFLTASIILIALLISVIALPTNPVKRFSLLEKDDYDSLTERVESIRRSLEVATINPLFGVGSGNLRLYAEPTESDVLNFDGRTILYEAYQHPHNQLLLMFAETGIVGLAAYLLLLTSFLKTDYLLLHSPQRENGNLVAFIVSSWVFMLGSFLDWYSIGSTIFFFLIRGCILGCSKGSLISLDTMSGKP
jgi:O-antigen ligase